MKSQWESFQGRQYRFEARTEARVTLGAKGTIYLNGVAYDALDRPAAVEMVYKGNQRIIGLKPIDPRKDNAFIVKKHHGNYHRISAAAFCQHLRLKFPRTLLFEKIEIDNEGVMSLDLNTALEVGRGAR